MAASPSPSPDVSNEIPVGFVVDGRYRIDGVLGTGGMGRVYRAEHTGIGRSVAIKMLHADLGRNPEAAARFQREAMASGRLDHTNIVGVSDFGMLEGRPYLVMEALEGESLGHRLERDKVLPWQEAIQILKQVLQGLKHAHDRGVVHRDIKPDNIFLTKKDDALVVKLLDFGIAKLYAGDPDDPMSTRTGLTVGTPTYLSPEQAVGAAITPPSDLYSATVVLYEMLAGRPPFDDDDPVARATAHVTRPPPTLASVVPQLAIPAALDAIVQQGLKKSVSERIPTAAAYLKMLDDFARGEIGSGPNPLATPIPGSLRAPALAPDEMSVTPIAAGEQRPMPARIVTLADLAEPIPRRWVKAAGVIVGVLILIAVALLISHCGSSKTTPSPKRSEAPSVPPSKPASNPVVVPLPVPTIDHDTSLKAALHDLESGRTCAERKAAIPRLVELDDPSAIPALKRARYNMHGGVFGFGEENWNACLKPDAEAAVKALGGTLK
jgi:serine/threonine protein kinase